MIIIPKCRNILVGGLAAVVASTSLAAVHPIPGSVIPGRIQTEVVPLPRPLPATQIHYADFPTCKVELALNHRKIRLKKLELRPRYVANSAEINRIAQAYYGTLITEQNLRHLADSIAQYYRAHGYFAAQVVVPKQSLGRGHLVLIVRSGAVSEVQIENKNPRIQKKLEYYADSIRNLKILTRDKIEKNILLAGEIVGSRLKAEIVPDESHAGCAKVVLKTDLQFLSADLGYDNYGVRWQGPQEYAANISVNSLFQAGDHTHVNAMMSVDGKELRYYAAEHNMPLGFAGTRLVFWANYAENNPGFTLSRPDFEGEAFSGGIQARYPFLLTRALQSWAKIGFRFIDEKITLHDHRFLKDADRVLVASVDTDFQDAWQGQTQAELSLSQGVDILGATEPHHRHFSKFHGETDFTKVNLELHYTRPLFNQFSVMVGGQGQYAFNPLLVSELMGVGGRYWGRAYDWSEIMGDSGVVGTIELRYDTKPGAPESKNTQYFLAYDAGEVWARHAPHRFHHQSLTSLQAGLRLDFTRYISADLVVAKPLTRDVLANELSGHSGDKVRAFFRVAAHL